MNNKKQISLEFSILLVVVILLSYTIPVQAELPARPLQASSGFVWAKGAGGTGNATGMAVAIDALGNVYTTGIFDNVVDFDPGSGIYNLTSNGEYDIFISKMDSNGNFVWAQSIGSTNIDYGYSIAINSDGNLYITGFFQSVADFDPGPDTLSLTSQGLSDIFVLKLDSNGSLVWVKSMGGIDNDEGTGIAIDSQGNLLITGYFKETVDFDPSTGTNYQTSAGSEDIFFTKLDRNGNAIWVKRMGGTGDDQGRGIALDPSSNIHIAGYFQDTVDFDPGPGLAEITGSLFYSIFIFKSDGNGNLMWVKSMGQSNGNSYNRDDQAHSIAVDSAGNVYTIGLFMYTVDFDPGPNTFNLTANLWDAFISKLDRNGNFVWAKPIGGPSFQWGYGIAVDAFDNIYMAGVFNGPTDFDPGPGTVSLFGQALESFLAKWDNNGNFLWAKSLGYKKISWGYGIATDSSNNCYATGGFSGTANFDPEGGTATLTSVGINDVFVTKHGKVGVAPTVVSVVRANASPTSQDKVSYIVTFSKDVTGVDIGDFSLTTTGINNAKISAVTGSGKAYMVSAETGSGNGTLRLNILNDDTIKDAITLASLAMGNVIPDGYIVLKSPTFGDVPLNQWASASIERLYNSGITGGCSTNPLSYCPTSPVTRAQMAVFLLRGIHGASFFPPALGGSTGFTDVDATHWAAAWIKQLAAEAITSGCGGRIYCPENTVTRAQMAVFLLKAMHGSSYSPPNVTATFGDTSGHWAEDWIEQLAAEGITSGCGGGLYCPDNPVTRDQMAVFLVRAFNLP